MTIASLLQGSGKLNASMVCYNELVKQGGLKMNDYNDFIIETKNLTKQYGAQKSVNALNIHVRKAHIWAARQKRRGQNHHNEDAARPDAAQRR